MTAASEYYQLRTEVAQLVPRSKPLFKERQAVRPVKEKGRKTGYREFKLDQSKWVTQERLLNTEEVSSFVEVSCRAAACPMPLNVDVWDGLLCPFACKYCYANAFRASLYTAFFDNSKTMGFRHCNTDYYKRELDKLLPLRGTDPHGVKGDVAKAIAMDIPMRFGIRFEDFLDEEREAGISLELLNYLADNEYPLMINTKASLVGEEKYAEALGRNPAGSAVHMTLISSNDILLKQLESGAPSYQDRLDAMQNLVQAGVRVVARIEPFLVFVNDRRDEVEQYIADVWDTGVRNITFDTYSYTAKNPGIRTAFRNVGIDWDRVFLLGCDSQGLGSLLLGRFMDVFREAGFSCSTFDMGNASTNDQSICCEVGDFFKGGFNYGCTVMAARHIQERACEKGLATSWNDFVDYVNEHGGFLSQSLKNEVHALWNGGGNDAYSHAWTAGLAAVGYDEGGIVWWYDGSDFREELV